MITKMLKNNLKIYENNCKEIELLCKCWILDGQQFLFLLIFLKQNIVIRTACVLETGIYICILYVYMIISLI